MNKHLFLKLIYIQQDLNNNGVTIQWFKIVYISIKSLAPCTIFTISWFSMNCNVIIIVAPLHSSYSYETDMGANTSLIQCNSKVNFTK